MSTEAIRKITLSAVVVNARGNADGFRAQHTTIRRMRPRGSMTLASIRRGG